VFVAGADGFLAEWRGTKAGGMTYVLRNPRRTAPEKIEERKARQLMETALGFTCWHLSQARATRQTPGWPDCFFTHPEKRLAVWYEAKAPKGKQSDAQKEFQRHVSLVGYDYVVGPAEVLTEWAIAKGLVKRARIGLEVVRESA
jgi:hypothetical protein